MNGSWKDNVADRCMHIICNVDTIQWYNVLWNFLKFLKKKSYIIWYCAVKLTINTKKNLKGVLARSIKSEEKSVKKKYDKFSKADAIFDEYEKRSSKNNESDIQEVASKKNRVKCIRDSFTMPVEDHKIINEIIDKFLDMKKIVNKSEVIRMALYTLSQLPIEELNEVYQSIEKVKIGRPK